MSRYTRLSPSHLLTFRLHRIRAFFALTFLPLQNDTPPPLPFNTSQNSPPSSYKQPHPHYNGCPRPIRKLKRVRPFRSTNPLPLPSPTTKTQNKTNPLSCCVQGRRLRPSNKLLRHRRRRRLGELLLRLRVRTPRHHPHLPRHHRRNSHRRPSDCWQQERPAGAHHND